MTGGDLVVVVVVVWLLFTEPGRVVVGAMIVLSSMLLLFVFFSGAARADEMSFSDKAVTVATCAATSGLVASKQTGFVSEAIFEVAGNFRNLLVELTSEEFADELIAEYMRMIQAEYNSGQTTWVELVEVSRSCALAWNDAK